MDRIIHLIHAFLVLHCSVKFKYILQVSVLPTSYGVKVNDSNRKCGVRIIGGFFETIIIGMLKAFDFRSVNLV